MIRKSCFLLENVLRREKIASNQTCYSQEKVSTPNLIQRWVIVEAENGDRILIRNQEEIKTASKQVPFSNYIEDSLVKTGYRAKKIASNIIHDFPHVKNLSLEDITSLANETKRILAEVDPKMIATLAEKEGYREDIANSSEDSDGEFVESFVIVIHPTVASVVSNELMERISFGIRNSTNIYKFINDTILSSGLGEDVVKSAIDKGISLGKLKFSDVDSGVFLKIVSSFGDNDENEYKKGFDLGFVDKGFNRRKKGSWLRGWFDGREKSYEFIDKKDTN